MASTASSSDYNPLPHGTYAAKSQARRPRTPSLGRELKEANHEEQADEIKFVFRALRIGEKPEDLRYVRRYSILVAHSICCSARCVLGWLYCLTSWHAFGARLVCTCILVRIMLLLKQV